MGTRYIKKKKLLPECSTKESQCIPYDYNRLEILKSRDRFLSIFYTLYFVYYFKNNKEFMKILIKIVTLLK